MGGRARFRRSLVCAAIALVARAAHAQVEGEVSGVAFDDPVTLRWSPASGATAYHVYAGTDPAGHDHSCRVPDVTGTSAIVPDVPSSGRLLYLLVSGSTVEGEGSLGADSSGALRPNSRACGDGDADLVPGHLDNCPVAFNPSQADQDEDGEGDRRTWRARASPSSSPSSGPSSTPTTPLGSRSRRRSARSPTRTRVLCS